jgi:glycosyltransferase involved in cell wall biosynthesis
VNYLLVIDHLGLGGAQRQLCELACGLCERGHHVEVLVYHPRISFFRPQLDAMNIPVHEVNKEHTFSVAVIRRLRTLFNTARFDVVISYLPSPNIYCELAHGGASRPKLIVSERVSHHDDRSRAVGTGRRLLHGLADAVVTNSETHATWLRGKWWLRDKTKCIYNGIALGAPPVASEWVGQGPQLRLLGVGRICAQKNIDGLIAGLQQFYSEHGYVPHISWAGRPEAGSAGRVYERKIRELLRRAPQVEAQWQWLGEQHDMRAVIEGHDALIHPAHYEGLPNSVCEALAAGTPVLISDVCDHSLLVADGERGFTFDPTDSGSIARAIGRLIRLSPVEWSKCRAAARAFAEANLSITRMVTAYEVLGTELIREGDLP